MFLLIVELDTQFGNQVLVSLLIALIWLHLVLFESFSYYLRYNSKCSVRCKSMYTHCSTYITTISSSGGGKSETSVYWITYIYYSTSSSSITSIIRTSSSSTSSSTICRRSCISKLIISTSSSINS